MHKPEFAQMVFEKVFVEDIERLLKMKDMWTNRTPPTVLNYHQLDREAKALAKTNPGSLTADDQAVPTAIQSFILFKTSLEKLAVRVRADNLALSFDKDDDDMLSFVTATANLRATAFGIDNKSRFQVKGKLVRGGASAMGVYTYVTYGGSRPRYFNSERLMPPNAACSVCRKRYMTISIRSFDEVTLGDVVEYLLGLSDGGGKDIGLTDEFTVTEGDRILYDVDFDDNLSKTLRQLSVGRGSCFVVVPEDENIGGSMQWGYSTLAVELMVVENPDLTPCVSIDGLTDAAAEYSQARHAGSATKGTKRKHDDGEDSLGVVGADADAEAIPHVKIAATDNAGLPDDDRRVQNHGVSIDIDNDDEVICLD
ncbi:E1 ubiquitin-activating protein uba2 [Spiromyces aspiralis]|uniref:E1 ubiquitin-activating protein uba2 n=1 Tax=Spiromyces aspiralis TaxID=68401 RepID=A0ACC1HYD6_9FUNG|nr:E1 ubiquitin-activating protein uba2 [Spiromyces aspiralis]